MAAKFIESSYTNKRDIARITTSNAARPLKEMPAGTEIMYDGYVLQEITNEQTGEVFTSIVVKDTDGNLYATRSESFIRALKEIIEICADDEEPIILKLERLQSRAGREFITCALA
ncbi:MAG TPA: hypothetical protein DCG33_05335 [Prevotellaceae bacterium]|nr:hypothetical protein [Prevotellaceae bacterium]